MIPRAILVVAFAMLALLSSSPVSAFTSIASPPVTRQISTLLCAETTSSATEAASSNKDPNELVARRITVVGDVQGGYYRACVKNEVRLSKMTTRMICYTCPVLILSFLFLLQASRFRRLVGTMTPPDDSDEAEIYVEGESTHRLYFLV